MSEFEKKMGHYLKMNKSKEFFDNLISSENIKESIDNLFSKDNCSCKQIIEIYSSNSNNPSSTIINNNNNINSENEKIIDRIKKFNINEKIILNSLLKIKEEATFTCKEIIKYKNDDILIERLFYSIEKIVHKNLHYNKELYKNCEVLTKEEISEFKDENNINICSNNNNKNNFNNLEKIIENKQKDNKQIEFIAIKTIIISMMNITTEMTCIYLKTLVKNNNNNNNNNLNENSFDIKDFKIIHEDYVLVSNYCPTLENYFQKSFENFKKKYQINFTLSELFADIFWNSLFHRKIFCESFINNYGSENISKSIQEDLNKIIKCLSQTNLSLKHQISELLEIKELTEKNEKYDLISLINVEKNKNQRQIFLNNMKEDKKNNNNNIFKSLSFTNNNNNNINLNNSSSDEDILSSKDLENFEIKEDKTETTITRILEYNSTTVEKFHDKKIIEKKEIYRYENIIENNFKNHIKNNKFIELLDDGNNKKENIFNTIDIINNSNDNNNNEEEFKIDSPEFKFIKTKEFTPINELLQNKFNNKNNNNSNKNNNKLNINKSKKNKNNNENLIKNLENKTLDEIYNYIIDDNKNNKQITTKKKKNKKKKNKENNNNENLNFSINNNNNNNNNNYNNYNNNELDPIVEQFKSELNTIVVNALDIQKIKPAISTQWIESIEKCC